MILFLKPVFFDKIWGGDKLRTLFNYPTSTTCGEAWGISAHKNGESIILNGKYKGYNLSTLFDEEKELFGNYLGKEFPILVKIINAKRDLSIQVHPNDIQAKEYNSLGKTECWFILDSEKDTNIIIGHSAKTKKELRNKINEKHYSKLLNKFKIQKGDYFFIDSGTIHAICKNTVLLEVQQSSDITYRVYDYDRLDFNGKLRPLHVKESIECIKIPDNIVKRQHDTKFFNYEILDIVEELNLKASKHGDYIVVIEGFGMINDVLCKAGDFIMVSSRDSYQFKGNLKIQKTWF